VVGAERANWRQPRVAVPNNRAMHFLEESQVDAPHNRHNHRAKYIWLDLTDVSVQAKI